MRFLGCGLLMGAADVVPGVSGGTVALVLGIYRRLVDGIRNATRVGVSLVRGNFSDCFSSLRSLDYLFLVPLSLGILLAVGLLARPIETLLVDYPVEIAGLFFGLVLGSIIVTWGLLRKPKIVSYVVAVGIGGLVFVLLGFQSGPVTDPAPLVLLGAGALAICAMILPGISGSFILLMIGMYAAVIGSISNRNFIDLLFLAVGALAGLALFSQVLGWVLERYHDLVTAAMVGLMVGSLRVLWPWPNGVGVISDAQDEVINGAILAWPTSANWLTPVLLALAAGFSVLGLSILSRTAPD